MGPGDTPLHEPLGTSHFAGSVRFGEVASSPSDHPKYDRDSWERRWSRALTEGGHAVDTRPPNAHLVDVAEGLEAGRALDAGAGHGSETLWLAERGWPVTSLDFSSTALDHARARAERKGSGIAGRISFVTADLTVWEPPAEAFDLVACLHVHVPGSVTEMVGRLASGVAPGGTMVLVGQRPIDPASGEPTRAATQVQVTSEDVREALEEDRWDFLVAEDRPRRPGDGVDSVTVVRRKA